MNRSAIIILVLAWSFSAMAAPTATFESLTGSRIAAGQPLFVDAGGSYADPGTSILSYQWQWACPTLYQGQEAESFPFSADADGVRAEHLFACLGSYRVTLRVCDDRSSMAIAQQIITVVAMAAPTAVPGGPYELSPGENLVLDGTASFDPDAAYGDRIVKYEWLLAGGYVPLAQGAQVTIPWSLLEDKLLSLGYDNLDNTFHDLRLKVTDTTGRSHTMPTGLTIVPTPSSLALLAAGTLALLKRNP